jgi:hypothetical protein
VRSLSAPRVAPYNWTRGAEAVPTTWVNGFDSESRDLNRALDGLVTLQVSGEQKLLPIWHEITKDEVMTTSPSLADKIARSTTQHIIERSPPRSRRSSVPTWLSPPQPGSSARS